MIFAKEIISISHLELVLYTVTRNYGMTQNFADVNPEWDFQPFNDEKNSHLKPNLVEVKQCEIRER